MRLIKTALLIRCALNRLLVSLTLLVWLIVVHALRLIKTALLIRCALNRLLISLTLLVWLIVVHTLRLIKTALLIRSALNRLLVRLTLLIRLIVSLTLRLIIITALLILITVCILVNSVHFLCVRQEIKLRNCARCKCPSLKVFVIERLRCVNIRVNIDYRENEDAKEKPR